MAETVTIQYIDKLLREYYDFKGQPGYDDEDNLGTFAKWADENGYGSDEIKDELDADEPEESDLAEIFDMDDFPCDLKTTRQKLHYMYCLMRLGRAYGESKKRDVNWEPSKAAFHVYKHQARLCPMTDTEFALVAAEEEEDDSKDKESKTYKHKIWVYDQVKSSWRYANDYDSWKPDHGSFAWEKTHDQFYSVNSDKIQIVDGRRPGKSKEYPYKELQCLNNASKFITHVNPIEDEREMQRTAMFKYWEGSALFEYEKEPRMHCMGGRGNACHCKFLPERDNLHWDITFPNLYFDRGCVGLGVVYVKHRQWVVIMGGNIAPAKEQKDELSNQIQVYQIKKETRDKKQAWASLNATLPFPMKDFGCAVDRNERFIVISHREHGIWRFSLRDGLWEKSSVATPTDQIHSITILGGSSQNRMAYRKAEGYWKYVCKYGGMRYRIPTRALFILTEYLEEKQEFVHTVDLYNGGHWRYSLRDLFYTIVETKITENKQPQKGRGRRRDD